MKSMWLGIQNVFILLFITGRGRSKKLAKRQAAHKMMEQLKNIPADQKVEELSEEDLLPLVSFRYIILHQNAQVIFNKLASGCEGDFIFASLFTENKI